MKLRKKLQLAPMLMAGLFMVAQQAAAAVMVTSGPTSLVTAIKAVPASSGPVSLFSFDLKQDAGESLSSVNVRLSQSSLSTTSPSDIAALSVYRDDGNGVFDSGDLLAGTQASVNINTSTAITVGSNNQIASSTATSSTRFFVTFGTSGSWSDAVPMDVITATLLANGITTSTSSPTSTAAITAEIFADTTGPRLLSAIAKNTGGTNAKEAGDSINFTFSEPTNKPSATSTNFMSLFSLNNGHTYLDATSTIGSANWNTAGTLLTLVLSGTASTTVASVNVGDTTTVVAPSMIKDPVGNLASGQVLITGNFGGAKVGTGAGKNKCANGLINGRLYRVNGDSKIYLAAACRLKEFKGKAFSKAKGKKFKNIITIASLDGLTVKPQEKKHENDEKEKKENEKKESEKKNNSSNSNSQSNSSKGNGKDKKDD